MRYSRGRGNRGRGRGGGSGRHAPQLPFKLRKELDDASGEHKPRKGSGSMFAVSRRKEERKAARHRGGGRGAGTSGGRHAESFKPFSSRPEQVTLMLGSDLLAPALEGSNKASRCQSSTPLLALLCRDRRASQGQRQSGLQNRKLGRLLHKRRPNLTSCLATQGLRCAARA